MLNKIGTVCQVGVFNTEKQTFKQAKDTTIGVVQRKSLLAICGLSNIDDLTPQHLVTYHYQLRTKVLDKVKQNLNALYNQLLFISELPTQCHMLRISSNLLPMLDHPQFKSVYDEHLLTIVDSGLTRCKKLIDKHDIVVCTHPDQYSVINSESEHIRQACYNALYAHKYFMERLTNVNVSSINIHLNGNLDHLPEIDKALHNDLVPWLSFENEDKNGRLFTGSTINTLEVCERYNIKMLFDMHHHLALEGKRLSLSSPLFKRIVDTWNGYTPIMHISQGKDSQTDRKHSNFITDTTLIDYAKQLAAFAHIEVEAKAKTNAVLGFYKEF